MPGPSVRVCWWKNRNRGSASRTAPVTSSGLTPSSARSTGGNWTRVCFRQYIHALSSQQTCNYLASHTDIFCRRVPERPVNNYWLITFFSQRFKPCYWSCCVKHNKYMLNSWLRRLSPCVVSAQGSFRPPLCQTPRQFMPRTSTTSGPSPRSRACSWSTRTWSFSTSSPRGTSPSPGRRRWLRRASTGSWRCGGPTALCPTTSDASPSWSSRPSPPPAQCRRRLGEKKNWDGCTQTGCLSLKKTLFLSTFNTG